MQFRIKIELLNEHYNKDPEFFVTSLRSIFEKDVECLQGDSKYALLYDAIIIHNYLLEQFDMNTFEYHVQSIMDRFKILQPLFKSIAFILDKEIEEEFDFEEIQSECIDYIQKNNLQLEMKHIKPEDEVYKKKFYEYIEKMHIQESTKDVNLENIVQLIQSNIKEYLTIIDILMPYIIDLESFYIELTDKLYASKQKK